MEGVRVTALGCLWTLELAADACSGCRVVIEAAKRQARGVGLDINASLIRGAQVLRPLSQTAHASGRLPTWPSPLLLTYRASCVSTVARLCS
eukprot:364457-Rhodomonas_salina.2